MSSRVVINSISITPQLASDVEHLKGLVEKDLRRARKHLSPETRGHGPRAIQEARKKQHHHPQGPGGGSSSKPPSGGQVVNVTDATVTYMMACAFGDGQEFSLLIDTGSSNTWCGAAKEFDTTDASCQRQVLTSTRKPVKCGYGSGQFEGMEYTGPVTLGGSLKIDSQSFAVTVPSQAQGFNGIDGILGIGPVDLTATTVDGVSSISTVTDNLAKQGTIKTETIGISYNPTTTSDGTISNISDGSITFGDVDMSKFEGDITYVDITSTSPASKYWGIDQTITYGSGGTEILSQTAGIVDTGTTLCMVPDESFKGIQKCTGATLDAKTGLLKLSKDQYEQLESMYFKIGSTTFEFTANAQCWPRSLNAALGGDPDSIYLVWASMGELSMGSGLDFINGFTWLQRFYSVYDTTNSRVGIANTPNTKAETN